MGRREDVLDGAIEVVAAGGMRALTHRAVDNAAGLPLGATSNVFRTRRALTQGILIRIAEREIEIWQSMDTRGEGIDALLRHLTALVERLSRQHRSLELARRAVFADATINRDVEGGAADSTRMVTEWAAERLDGVGSASPHDDALILLAMIDALIGDRLAGTLQRKHTARAIRAVLDGLL